MTNLRDVLSVIGCCEETITEAIRLGGDRIPVFGSQMKGYYIRPDGRRETHFAVPGWYQIESTSGDQCSTIVMRSTHPRADAFECGSYWLPGFLGANLECVTKGVVP